MSKTVISESRSLTLNANAVAEEFKQLDEQSRRLYIELRELPPASRSHWKPYFVKTFDVFTKLWKFQQAHRKTLETQMSLKRWQVGEIASRIGQLYYHYYLRTSETRYLQEAFNFYSAIHSRKYFSDLEFRPASDQSGGSAKLSIKVLRFYARFLLVSLMLDDMQKFMDLAVELSSLHDQYYNGDNNSRSMGSPKDGHAQWKQILDDVDRCSLKLKV